VHFAARFFSFHTENPQILQESKRTRPARRIEITAMARVFLLLLLPLGGAFGAESPVATPAYQNAPGSQQAEAIATSGREFLVLWLDGRPAGGLYATRTTSGGLVADQTGIRIADSATRACALWNGDAYVVFWIDAAENLFSIRVARNGAILGAPRTIATGARAARHFAAMQGTSIGVVYTSGGRLQFLLLSRDGEPIAGQAPLTIPAVARSEASLASNGGTLLATWIADGGVEAIRPGIDAQPFPVAAGTFNGAPLLASEGRDFVIVTTGVEGLEARRIAEGKTPGAPHALGGGAEASELIWSGDRYSLFLTSLPHRDAVLAMETDREGKPLGPRETLESSDLSIGFTPVVAAYGGGDIYIAWSDTRLDRTRQQSDVFGYLPQFGLDLLLSISATQQHEPAIARDGTRFFVAWREERAGGTNDIFGARIDSAGRSADGRGVLLSRGGGSSDTPRVLFDGTNFLVAWINRTAGGASSVVTQRISREGVLLDGNAAGIHQFLAEGCIDGLDLTSDGITPLIVWSDCASGRVFAARASSGGIMSERAGASPTSVPSGTITAVSPAGLVATAPRTAWNGASFAVVWQEGTQVRAARLTQSLNLLDAPPLTIGAGAHPAVAAAGREFLVAWESGGTIFARHLDVNGALLDAPLTIARGRAPSLIADGARWRLAWESDGAIETTHVDRTGLPLPGDLGRAATGQATSPALAPGAVVYSRVASGPAIGGVYRVMIRLEESSAGRVRAVR
jgi:hypothetical protein